MTPNALQFWRVWSWPLGIAALTMFGLLSALIGEGGVWWWLSWAALLTPLAIIIRYWPLKQLFARRATP